MGDSSKNSAKAVSTLVLCRYKPWKCRKAAVMERSQISSRREWFHVFFSLFTCFIYLCIMYLFIYLILTRGREGEREGEKHHCVAASQAPPTGDLAHNPDRCPDGESNRQTLGSQAGAQFTEPHHPGRFLIFLMVHFTNRKPYMLVFVLM